MKLLLKILFLALPLSAFSQLGTYLSEPNEYEADSLRLVFENTTNDTLKMETSRYLGFYYHEKNTDSALYYQQTQLDLASKLGFKLWEADALELCGFLSRNRDRYPISLQYFQKAFSIAKDPNSEINCWKPELLSMAGTPSAARLSVLAFIHLDIGSLYNKTSNYEKEIYNFTESIRIAEQLKDPILLSLTYGSFGDVFFRLNKLDSALYYFQYSQVYAKKSQYLKYEGSTLNNIGSVYFKRGDYDKASLYYYKAIVLAKKTGNYRSLAVVYIDLSKLFLITEQADSSLIYTRDALRISKMLKNPIIELSVTKMLTQIFAKTKDIDSAYFYQNAAISISDSMSREEKIVHMQNLEFSEQLRLSELLEEQEKYENMIKTRALISGLVLIIVVALILYRNSRVRRKAYKLLSKQRNEIQITLTELKTTQKQLVHSEKMASLGELTAGIAHEIQNPLNFVNNFSEVSNELIVEMNEEMANGDYKEASVIADDIKQNLEKISNHGKRASSIVRGMLEHSRTGNNKKQPTDINAMVDEYIRLAYHGMRAKDNSIQADFEVVLDENIKEINIVGQDIARVILNLINNAFQACAERSRSIKSNKSLDFQNNEYKPTVIISTKLLNNVVEIRVKDNGNGIPEEIKEKIFQPFFTTKPTGEGTGLGLSLSYDIITKGHGGVLEVEPTDGEGTSFIVKIPLNI